MATGRIGTTPALGFRWSESPAGGTTSLSGLDDNSVGLSYTPGNERVYRNGVLLSRGSDYTATDGTTITLEDATITGDIIEVFSQDLAQLTDAISKSSLTAKGTLLSASAASTLAVLGVGANDTVLTADSAETTGLKWVTPAAGNGMDLLSTTAITNIAEISITGISQDYDELVVLISNAATVNTNVEMFVRVNSNNGASNYTSVYATPQGLDGSRNATSFQVAGGLTQTANVNNISVLLRFPRYTETTPTKMMQSAVAFTQSGGIFTANVGSGATRVSSAISSLQFFLNSGNWTAQGNIYIYGVK